MPKGTSCASSEVLCTCCTNSYFRIGLQFSITQMTPGTVYLSVRTFRSPSVVRESPLLKFASASSQARPAPNPVPSHTGHALRLNNKTENMTPKEKPRPDLITNDEIARSHFSFSRASLTGLDFGTGRGGPETLSSGIV